MTAVAWIIAAILTPVAGAVLLATQDRRPNLRDGITIATGIVTLVCNIVICAQFMEQGSVVFTLGSLLPGLDVQFATEPLGIVFALVASSLWIVTSLFGFGYMRGHHEIHQTRFFTCFALAIGATLAIAYSGNLLTLFIFYEVLTLSTYPLVTHHGDDKARAAGRLYLGILLSTSIGLFLLGLIYTWQTAGTTTFTDGGILAGHLDPAYAPLLLALFVFGTGKAAVMPVHRWLPAAMVAPTPVSALLHAVAVVKAGVFTVLKITVYIFGIDYLSETAASTWLMAVAAFTIVVASVIAIGKDNLKARLAYSTISQLSYIVLGASFATAAGVLGAGMHIVMHAFAKITLFFCAGAIYVAAHKTEVSALDGIGRRMPWTMTAFTIASASLIGLPLTGGMWSKWWLSSGAVVAGWSIYSGVLALSSLLSIGYLAPIVVRAFFASSPQATEASNLERAHPLLYLPPLFTAICCIALFFSAAPIYEFLLPLVQWKASP